MDADEMKAFNRGRAVRAAWEAWPNRIAGIMAAELGVDPRNLRITCKRFVREHLLDLNTMEREDSA